MTYRSGSTPVAQLYRVALRHYREPQYNAENLIQKRIRAIVRLLALEARAAELGLDALPGRTVEALQQIARVKELPTSQLNVSRVEEVRTLAWSVSACECGSSRLLLDALSSNETLVYVCLECGHEYHVSGAQDRSKDRVL